MWLVSCRKKASEPEKKTAAKPLRYLSLFAGIGGFELGIQLVFPAAVCVGYSEINPHANAIYQSHFPASVSLGDIRYIDFTPFRGKIDLVVAGFPCQDLSVMGTRGQHGGRGLEGDRSSVFFEVVRCLQECNPRFFLLENVASMTKENQAAISQALSPFGSRLPVKLDAQSFTAQHRERLFWANFGIPQPTVEQQTRAPLFASVLDPMSEVKKLQIESGYSFRAGHFDSKKAKCGTVLTSTVAHADLVDRRFTPPLLRRLSFAECERLQGFPANWTFVEGMATCHRNKALGNAVPPPVIAFALECLAKLV